MNVPLDFFTENTTRYRKLIRGETLDYAPFRLWIDNTFICEFTKTDPTEFVNDFEVMLGAQKKVNERFYDQIDFCAYVDYYDIFFERDTFISDNPKIPANRFLETSLKNFDRYYSKRKFEDTPGVKRLLACIDYFNQRLPKHKQICHYYGVWGALDLFSVFRGTGQFFTDLYDSPKEVHAIFSYITERSLQWLEFVKKTWGGAESANILFDKLDIGEDYCAYLPPDLFDEFVKPYTGRLLADTEGVLKSLHTDGDFHLENMPKLKEIDVEELMGFTPNMDIKTVRSILPDIILAGNIHPIKVMNNGSPENVKNAVKYCFENANQKQKFVLCTGGGIGAGAKPENIDAFLEAAYEIVKY